MKKLLFIPILFVAFLTSYAQDVKKENGRRPMNKTSIQKSPEQKAELMTKKLTEQLSLTKEQQERIYKISLEQVKFRSEQAKKIQALTKLIKEENQKSHQEIKNTLTTEQQQKWDELKIQQRKFRRDKIDSLKRDFKSKPGMIKKPDSIGPKKPANKIAPVRD
jgi:hypothetical protein